MILSSVSSNCSLGCPSRLHTMPYVPFYGLWCGLMPPWGKNRNLGFLGLGIIVLIRNGLVTMAVQVGSVVSLVNFKENLQRHCRIRQRARSRSILQLGNKGVRRESSVGIFYPHCSQQLCMIFFLINTFQIIFLKVAFFTPECHFVLGYGLVLHF